MIHGMQQEILVIEKHMMICIKFFGMLITFGMIDGFLHLELLEAVLMRY